MLATSHRKTLAASLALILAGVVPASWAGGLQRNTDMGLAATGQRATVTLVLRLHDQAALESYIRQTVTPGSPHYHQFLSTGQFADKYGASDAQIAQVQAFLRAQGLQGTVLPNRMAIRTSGTLGQFGRIFQAPIHSYVSPATGRTFHRPATALVLPPALAGTVLLATGLDNERAYLSHRISAPKIAGRQPSLNALARKAGSGNPTATGEPGNYTVGDVANLYDINPLYARGITGRGSTIAIVTLSNFDPADAEAYWSGIGLATKPHRITQIHVDGGGAIDGGSGETALDVEQSGGLAPDADVLVYDAPNAGNGFTDAFMQAVADNRADSISTSWGSPEIFNFAALNVDGASNTDTTDVGDLQTFHQILLEAAAQGQSVFAATGDSGAYDTVRPLGHGSGPGQFSAPLTVDSPASDPYITAAGGTTVPYSFSFASGPTASITQESVWGWDYLQNYLDKIKPGAYDLFAGGGGGGVSVYWRMPFYQWFTQGMRTSEKNQSLVYNDPQSGPFTYLKLPGHFSGRNLPDISLNADPETGYIVVSSSDGGVISEGGTSFVAPQLNGISALLAQSAHHRIGFWNPQLYLLQNVFGYGRYSAFNDIRAGDNWFYAGKPRYDQGVGIGTLDVAHFDLFLRSGL
ncbi:peptidase S53 [Frateuria sp. Soil773]|uniref:S53 family peptidase n=1 Tax=Frateuria sp. Soil773 TaxID=1736407 RepID=UPI0007012379|nr:S53 family peptidase [Frateuria sp. Soil773]KRE88667.1 peptidase S53 [Frateuria sp. Soil773]